MAIARFLAAQVLRGNNVQEVTVRTVTEIAKKLVGDAPDSGLRQMIEDATGEVVSDQALARQRSFAQDSDGYTIDQPGAPAYLLADNRDIIVKALTFGHVWQVAKTEQPLLVTSDVPATLRPATGHTGLSAPEEILFPLDPRHVLILTPRDLSPDDDPLDAQAVPTVDASPELVERSNQAVTQRSDRCVYSQPAPHR